MNLLPLTMLIGEAETPFWMPVAAAVFLAGGVVLLVGTLRRTLLISKAQLEDEVRKWQSESDFWRTMDAAVEQLHSSVAAIDQGIKERSETLKRLSEEADASTKRLEKLIEEAKVAATLAPKKPTRKVSQNGAGLVPEEGQDQDDTGPLEKGSGRVVHMEQVRDQIAKRHRRVYEMFDSGHTVLDISKETALDIGEIELILAIRQRGVGG
jgi:hypothetical protein